VLVALGRVGFSSFGELDADGHPPGLGLLPALVRRAERIRDVRGRRTFLSLLDREADLFTPPPRPVLVHDDLHPGNLLLRRTPAGWRLAAVLDWDKAWAGPAESDLARLAFWDGMTGPAFWSAVAAPPPDPAADRRRLVHQLLWALEHDAPTARHRADTAALLTRLGIA
jgi:fructosamine-3-kinase